MATLELVDRILRLTRPLDGPRRTRLPLLLWPLTDLDCDDDARIEACLAALGARGLAMIASWDHADHASLERALRLGRIAAALGQPVIVNANRLLHRFCDGSEPTAHTDAGGSPFFDLSHDPRVPIGCPFALDHRIAEIRGRVERFADAYAAAGLAPGLVFADWEIDGPMEANGAWDAARRCVRCRASVPGIDEYAAFQAAIRSRRAALQKAAFAGPLTERFPGLLVGNYAVHPHDGWRYWYDWFEQLAPGAPWRSDRGARYRPWAEEFAPSGYTMAMPVLYPWYRAFGWYDFADSDYRWAYPMLLEASGAGRSTRREVPLVPFVHWHATSPPPDPDPAVPRMSAAAWQEMLWHVLLRGAATLFLWCRPLETEHEVPLVHAVFREAQEHAPFLDRGAPVLFDVPAEPGAVVSARRLGSRLLVRRTDFGRRARGPVTVRTIDGEVLKPSPGAAVVSAD